MTEPTDSPDVRPSSQASEPPEEVGVPRSQEVDWLKAPQTWWQWGKQQIQSLRSGTQDLQRWFQVDEAQVATLLAQIRAELPTTQVILIGKPQTGKSSIVRAMTGASPEIIGQGFRPHTTHIQRYTYPTEDLPLLIFTDTIGLGEGQQTQDAIVQELQTLLAAAPDTPETQAAKIIILTVKVNDFATDSLQQVIQQLRHDHPEVPCLLAITCLHELYPTPQTDHDAYPPQWPDLQRASAALDEQFSTWCDGQRPASGHRTVLIDFTLEEDGFDPVFFGLNAFVEALADLLPEAEARMIHQLLEQAPLGDQIGGLYREAGRRYILPFAVMAATLAAVPLPFATMPVLTSLQVTLIGLLGRLYGQSLSVSQAGGVASAIAGGFLAQMIGRELIKFIPGFGSVVAASWAAAYTWALGEGACVYFGDLLGGHKPDPKKIQDTMKQAFQEARERFKHTKVTAKS